MRISYQDPVAERLNEFELGGRAYPRAAAYSPIVGSRVRSPSLFDFRPGNFLLGIITAVLTTALPVIALAQSEGKPAHFHHVHLNVTDPAKTIQFYTKYFGAVKIDYHDTSPALFTERSFLLLNEVDTPPAWEPHSALSHIGWAAVDGQNEYEWLKREGLEFETPIGQLGNNYGMYLYGPDKELVELWTGSKNHRFEHLHLWATDVKKSVQWFSDHLGFPARVGPKPTLKDRENIAALHMAFLQSDNVNLVFFGRPDFESRWWPGGSYTEKDAPKGDFAPTKGRAIDHIAFSYRNIEPVFDRMKAAGVEIVEPIAKRPGVGHRSFFVLAPDNLLVEIVQAKPIPESSWED